MGFRRGVWQALGGQQHLCHERLDLQARLERQQPGSGLERKLGLAARQVQLGHPEGIKQGFAGR